MTLIVTVQGNESIWMLADRRLSFDSKVVSDSARKIVNLQTTDAVALFGYAGLGSTGLGTESSDWMTKVLCGRKFPLEQSIAIVAEAMTKQFPPHLRKLSGTDNFAHLILIPAIVEKETRLYIINLASSSEQTGYEVSCARHVTDSPAIYGVNTFRTAVTGSGASYLMRNRGWSRDLIRLVTRHDKKQLTALRVADELAALNYKVSQGLSDNTVGPNSIVVWRFKDGGGSHQTYTGTSRDSNIPGIPTIGCGLDIGAITETVLPDLLRMFEDRKKGKPIDHIWNEIDEKVRQLPETPDEDLR